MSLNQSAEKIEGGKEVGGGIWGRWKEGLWVGGQGEGGECRILASLLGQLGAASAVPSLSKPIEATVALSFLQSPLLSCASCSSIAAAPMFQPTYFSSS